LFIVQNTIALIMTLKSDKYWELFEL